MYIAPLSRIDCEYPAGTDMDILNAYLPHSLTTIFLRPQSRTGLTELHHKSATASERRESPCLRLYAHAQHKRICHNELHPRREVTCFYTSGVQLLLLAFPSCCMCFCLTNIFDAFGTWSKSIAASSTLSQEHIRHQTKWTRYPPR